MGFRMAGKMGKGTGTRSKWGKVLSGQGLIVDHFDKKGQSLQNLEVRDPVGEERGERDK